MHNNRLRNGHIKTADDEMHIDTTAASKNLARLFHENKTYFLNGAWGAGKTMLLKEAEKYSDRKFVFLDLWQVKDEKSVIAIAFQKVHPFLAKASKLTFICSVIVSILMTNVVDIGVYRLFSRFFSTEISNCVLLIAGIISLFVATWSFFKVKSDAFYINLLNSKVVGYLSNIPLGKQKILVIDDFDRVEENRQEQAYVLFNVLNRKLPIVFVGDYRKLAKNTDKYLQKIIDSRVELPFVLHPSNLWKEYFADLSNKLGDEVCQEFISLVIGENRNLRERKHFNDFVTQEFFERGKLNHVQMNDQLLVIYVFLFHNAYYEKLVNDESFGVSDEILKKREANKRFNGGFSDFSVQDRLLNALDLLSLQEGDLYPLPYSKNRLAYLLYEEASNMTVEEIESIFNDKSGLKKNLLSGYNTDFYKYLTSEYKNFSESRKHSLVSTSIDLIKDFKTSPVLEFIIREKENEIMPPKIFHGGSGGVFSYEVPKEQVGKTDEEINNEIFDGWNYLLDQHAFDFSMKLYFLENFHIFSFADLGVKFPNLSLDKTFRRSDVVLLVYISAQDLWSKYCDWDRDLWEKILSLSDVQFITFCLFQGILNHDEFSHSLDFFARDKTYKVWTSRYSHEPPFEEVSHTLVIDKIKSKLNVLKKQGYSFNEQVDEKFKKFRDN